MISLDLFRNEMAKVDEQFGANKFSQRKRDLIYLALKNLKQEQLVKIFDDIIGNSKFTPTLDDFRDRARQYDNSNEKYDCNTCSGGGLVSVNHKATGVAYAFICDCQNGRKFNRNTFQLWRNQNQNLFTRLAPRKIDFSGKTNCYEGVAEDFRAFQGRFCVQK